MTHLAGVGSHCLQTQMRAAALAPPSQESLAKIEIVHQALLQIHDVEISTEHVLHAGMYARTIRLEAGVVMVGSLIKVATILIIHGSTSLYAGGDEFVALEGFNILPGYAGRKGMFVTHGPVQMTMLFSTQATTVEEAENEGFAEAEALQSRKDSTRDTTTITGS